MAFTITDDREKQLKVYASLHGLAEGQSPPHPGCLTDAMAEADSKLARFVGLDAYHAAGGTHADRPVRRRRLSRKPGAAHTTWPPTSSTPIGQRAGGRRLGLGRGQPGPRLEHDSHACGRIHPQPADVPQELLDQKAATEAELEEIEQALEDTESDALIDAQDEAEAQLAEIEEAARSPRRLRPRADAIRRLLRLDRPRRRAFRRERAGPPPGHEAAGRWPAMPARGEAQGHAGDAPPRPRSLPACRSPRRRSPGTGDRPRPAGLHRRLRRVRSRLARTAAWTCISGRATQSRASKGDDRRRALKAIAKACRWHG